MICFNITDIPYKVLDEDLDKVRLTVKFCLPDNSFKNLVSE